MEQAFYAYAPHCLKYQTTNPRSVPSLDAHGETENLCPRFDRLFIKSVNLNMSPVKI